MTKRRSSGDSGHTGTNNARGEVAPVPVGYTPAGKRIVRRASDKSKTKALKKLHEKLRDKDDDLPSEDGKHTVAQAVRDRLAYGLTDRNEDTVTKCKSLADNHIIPWLTSRAKVLSADTLRQLRSILKRAITRAQKRDKVKRNVVLLCEVPRGQEECPVQVAHRQAGRGGRRSCRGYGHVRLHCPVAARRCPHRGTAGAALVSRPCLRRRTKRLALSRRDRLGPRGVRDLHLALRTSRRRDQAIPPITRIPQANVHVARP
jgi:hypothetical protein